MVHAVQGKKTKKGIKPNLHAGIIIKSDPDIDQNSRNVLRFPITAFCTS